MKSIVDKIEDKFSKLMEDFKNPTKALLGQKEWKELNDFYFPIERKKNPDSAGAVQGEPTISAIVTNLAPVPGIKIFKTKHKSYLRVL